MARNKIVYGKAYVYKNVSSIVTAPYGGTLLGFSDDGVNFDPNILVVDDEVSEQVSPSDVRDMGAYPQVNINLLEWDVEQIKCLFNGDRIESLGGGQYSVNFPGDVVPGAALAEDNFLIVPEDTELQTAIYIPAGKVHKVSDEDIAFNLERSVFPLLIKCLIKQGVAVGHAGYKNRQLQIAKLSNIRLIS